MPIYTRKGDKGETSLWGGTRVLKSSLRVDTYGTVDELDSLIGVVVSKIQKSKVKSKKYKLKFKSELEQIQHDLLLIGSTLANLNAKPLEQLSSRVDHFEKFIDEMTIKMPELRNFILPGGGEAGAMLHLSRTICRRVERRLVELSQKEAVDDHIIKYFNRLSDLFFTMARYANYKEKKKETIWSTFAKASVDKQRT